MPPVDHAGGKPGSQIAVEQAARLSPLSEPTFSQRRAMDIVIHPYRDLIAFLQQTRHLHRMADRDIIGLKPDPPIPVNMPNRTNAQGIRPWRIIGKEIGNGRKHSLFRFLLCSSPHRIFLFPQDFPLTVQKPDQDLCPANIYTHMDFHQNRPL